MQPFTQTSFVFHPAEEGFDLTKYDFIRKMLAEKNGWIQYHWQNTELGEKRAAGRKFMPVDQRDLRAHRFKV